MKQNEKNEYADGQEKVIRHFHRTDWLFVFVPMVLSFILLVIVPIVWSVSERVSGNPTEIGGFNFDGLVIIAGIILCSVFCAVYGLLALILSVLTRRNNNFRILLILISLFTATIFGICLFS